MRKRTEKKHAAYELRWDWARIIFTQRLRPNSAKLVAHAIAWSVNQDNGQAFRSHSKYAAMTGLSLRQVGYGIEALKSAGWIRNVGQYRNLTECLELLRLDEVRAAIESLNRLLASKALLSTSDGWVAKECQPNEKLDSKAPQLDSKTVRAGLQSFADNLNRPKDSPKQTDEASLLKIIEEWSHDESSALRKARDDGYDAETVIVRELKLQTRNRNAYSEIFKELPRSIREALLQRALDGTMDAGLIKAVVDNCKPQPTKEQT